jgi:hypothetical protein
MITVDNKDGAIRMMDTYQSENFIISGILAVLSGMQSFPDEIVIQSLGCSILWNIAYNNQRKIMRKCGAIGMLSHAMENYNVIPNAKKNSPDSVRGRRLKHMGMSRKR